MSDLTVKAVKRKITKKRIEISEDKAGAGKLGPETIANLPEDYEIMFNGKMCDFLIKEKVKARNIMLAYFRTYAKVDEEIYEKIMATTSKKKLQEILDSIDPKAKDIYEKLADQYDGFEKAFNAFKRKSVALSERGALWGRMIGIRGFSAYQLGIIMSHVKDISRFRSPSDLAFYAGMSSINGMPVTKANINKIKEYFSAQGREKEFAGFNTTLSGRMFVVVDCLIRSKGYFYNMYVKLRQRLETRARNEGSVEMIGEGEKAKEYMKGKNKQSLILWSDKNAKRRIARTLLHLIYTEWRTMKGLEARNPYPTDYLGHNAVIKLSEVLFYDANIKSTPKPEAGEEEKGIEEL